MSENLHDLRSYFPRFERTLTWADGTIYHVREVDDLTVAESDSMIADEQQFTTMSYVDRMAAFKRHLQALVVAPLSTRVTVFAGQTIITLDGDGVLDLALDDAVYVSGGLYVERRIVTAVADDCRSATVNGPWRHDAAQARAFRSIRREAFDDLTQKQFNHALFVAKTPLGDDEGDSTPPTAASEATT